MMPWIIHPTKVAHHVEYLRRDSDDRFIGYVIQFNKGDQTFAWTEHAKIGVENGIGAAKDLVEGITEEVV